MKKYIKGFTLIELLIVIAILGVLAVALLLTINPGEAQKKARDVKRQADLKTLQTIVDQAINDGGMTGCLAPTGAANCTSAGAGSVGNQPCTTNWLGNDVCAYANTVPTDPNNNQTRSMADSASATPVSLLAVYRVFVNGGEYEINVREESITNKNKLSGDGGNASQWLEAGTNLTITGN